MTARHRGWFQYEYGATNLAVHFLTSMITDGMMDSVGHETDPFDTLEASASVGGYPASTVYSLDPNAPPMDTSQYHLVDRGRRLHSEPPEGF
jgi:hypothetical protein